MQKNPSSNVQAAVSTPKSGRPAKQKDRLHRRMLIRQNAAGQLLPLMIELAGLIDQVHDSEVEQMSWGGSTEKAVDKLTIAFDELWELIGQALLNAPETTRLRHMVHDKGSQRRTHVERR